MLGKLIKYDFKWINKVMYIYFAILFIITIFIKVIENLEQTLLLVIVDKIVSGMFISCLISIIITCFMRIWGRFINNCYKDESYLTHTLPVTKKQLFDSKIIASILSLLLSILVIIISVAIIYLNDTTIETIKVIYKSLVDNYNGTFAVLFIMGLILLILLEAIYFMISGIFGIVIGYRFNNHKSLKSIIIGVGSYGALSIVSLIILSVMSKLADFKIVAGGFPTLSTIKIMEITSLSIYLAFNIFYYIVARMIFNKGVNID